MRFIFNEEQLLRLKKVLSNQNIQEDFLDDLIAKGSNAIEKGVSAATDFISGLDTDVKKKSQDVPSKADFIGDDVDDFWAILEGIEKPIGEQKYGTMTHQQDVEAVQIALQILGYSLPRFGTDGLFGPETAAAVKKFKLDNKIQDGVNEAFVAIGNETDSNLKVDNDTAKDKVNDELIDDVKTAAKNAGLTVTITTASTGHSKKTTSGNDSRHGSGAAVDISIINGVGSGDKKFKAYGNKLKDALVAMGYKWNIESGNDKAILWQTNIGGNHYNHIHVSNNEGVSAAGATKPGGETITPAMVKVLLSKLGSRGVTSDDLKKYIDPAVKTGGSAEFTDLDLTTTEGKETYEKICDVYISQRAPGSPVTGAMLANGAERAYKSYRKYVPAELALAQITVEGGLDAKPNSRPMKYKNPFNVGNTDNGKNVPFASFQDGVNAYYDLIARKYLVKGRTANDLVSAFTNDEGNRYASASAYETSLKTLIQSIRTKNAPLYAELAKKNNTQNLAEELLTEVDKRQVLKNTFGFNDEWANMFHNLSDKLSLWIADTYIKALIAEVYRNDIPEGEDPRRFVVQQLNNQGGPHMNDGWNITYKPMYEYILHWVRAPRREPINIRDLSLRSAYEQAQEWHDNLEIKKQSNYRETGDVFIDYRNADGVGYYWVNLHTNNCTEEAERMGHCARANTRGSELLSLRKVNEFGEGESYLTVDYRPGGIIGDFHRHGNKKPTARFHRQIVDFLINTTYPVTQLTAQGVHRYDENFHLTDLSAADLKRTFAGNPNLRFNINDPATWPQIIDAILGSELNLESYSSEVKIKLLKKAQDLEKGDQFAELFTAPIILDIMGDIRDLRGEYAETFARTFGGKLSQILTTQLDNTDANNQKQFFTDSLRQISQDLFDHYSVFCPYIDHGFRKFSEEQRIEILGSRGIKRTLFSCTDVVPFLSRYIENSPVDANGNIAVKTEENLWGLLKQNGETILHPQFAGITANRIDRTGKTYLIKNLQGAFFSFNPETGDYKRYSMKA